MRAEKLLDKFSGNFFLHFSIMNSSFGKHRLFSHVLFSHMLYMSLTVNISANALVIQLSNLDRVFLGNCKDSAAYKIKGKQTVWSQYTHTYLTALFPRLPGWAVTRKVKPVWILLKQKTVSSSGISWAICKSASRSRQITMPVHHHRPDAFLAAQWTVSVWSQ